MSFCEFFFLISRFYQVAGHISPVVVESDQTLIDFPDFPVGCVVWVWVGGFGVWGEVWARGRRLTMPMGARGRHFGVDLTPPMDDWRLRKI